jgi:hypothetical protein
MTFVVKGAKTCTVGKSLAIPFDQRRELGTIAGKMGLNRAVSSLSGKNAADNGIKWK